MDVQEARKLLAEERQRRAQACAAAINTLAADRGCRIVAVPYLTQDGRIAARVKIIAEER